MRVSVSGFLKADTYTVKLEGVREKVYRYVVFAGIRDRILIDRLDWFQEEIEERVIRVIEGLEIARASWGIPCLPNPS